MAMKKKVRKEIENGLIVDDYTYNSDVMEVLFTPYIDDNETWLTYYNPDSGNMTAYPSVEYSTFVGLKEEDILVKIESRFYIFNRACSF